LPVQQKFLGGLVGFFTCEIGTLNRIVHMWKYESLADREARRAARRRTRLGTNSSKTARSHRRSWRRKARS